MTTFEVNVWWEVSQQLYVQIISGNNNERMNKIASHFT